MKLITVIPTYWGRTGLKAGDAIYDHPTPLRAEGTLARALKSIKTLEEKPSLVLVIAVATSKDIEEKVEKKVFGIVNSVSRTLGTRVLVFGYSHLARVHALILGEGKEEYKPLLRLHGYSNVRNTALFLSHALGYEAVLFIDDDEVFEDPEFISKAKEFIGRKVRGKRIYGVAGYYLQPDGDYRIKKRFRRWMKYWNKYEKMNEAFDRIIATEPRLKETPFAFGGNMVIHRNLFATIPFDPHVPRGEDVDFVISARMFGFRFFLDNQLSIKHLPPRKAQPLWLRMRQDIYRFVYERVKIESQKDVKGATRVSPEDFDPYPGAFLRRDLMKKIEKSCRLLAEEYLARGDRKGYEETLKNVALAKTDAVPKFDAFDRFCEFRKRWRGLMRFARRREIRSEIREIVCGK